MKKFETKNINEAAPEEVRAYAQMFLGIPLEDLSDTEVEAKVRAAMEGETIFVSVEEPDTHSQEGSPPPNVSGPERGALVGTLGHEDPKVTLTLHAEERDGVVVNRHKEVGVNGVVWLLKRGESITIPYRVFHALNNAVRAAVTHTKDGEVRTQVVHNTPFNIEKMPPQEEIKAWQLATDGHFVP